MVKKAAIGGEGPGRGKGNGERGEGTPWEGIGAGWSGEGEMEGVVVEGDSSAGGEVYGWMPYNTHTTVGLSSQSGATVA